ncbi:hypothetical protein B0H15DRAFT_1025452 [Mycena belliarum]|uniref:Uncharacterized protein n=1 Tax=Mycena belliarum TaxID=1033014 RepID=A0AAD6XHK0_9AGAR|nr:hypothetical protein B0H15DRAFT_1025452 [Mycena belliae]
MFLSSLHSLFLVFPFWLSEALRPCRPPLIFVSPAAPLSVPVSVLRPRLAPRVSFSASSPARPVRSLRTPDNLPPPRAMSSFCGGPRSPAWLGSLGGFPQACTLLASIRVRCFCLPPPTCISTSTTCLPSVLFPFPPFPSVTPPSSPSPSLFTKKLPPTLTDLFEQPGCSTSKFSRSADDSTFTATLYSTPSATARYADEAGAGLAEVCVWRADVGVLPAFKYACAAAGGDGGGGGGFYTEFGVGLALDSGSVEGVLVCDGVEWGRVVFAYVS